MLHDATCASPVLVEERNIVVDGDGANFSDVYIDSFQATYDTPTCGNGRQQSPEAIFAVTLAAGERVVLAETGPLEAALKIKRGGCDDTAGICVASELRGDEARGAAYTAVEDVEELTLMVASATVEAAESPFEISIKVLGPEDCEVDGDENGDGLADCDEPFCFGYPGVCDLQERNCKDRGDNDADGLEDCDDPDCADARVCLPAQAVYETFSFGEFDLEGRTLVWTADAAEAQGYSYTTFESPGLPDVPGSGAVSASLVLGYRDSAPVALANRIEFFGVSYDTLYVGSDGYVTFEPAIADPNIELASLLTWPMVATLLTHLSPDEGGSVTVDQFAEHVTITFQDVLGRDVEGDEGPNTFQTRIFHNGDIDMTWLEVLDDVAAQIGVSSSGSYAYGPVDLSEM